MVKPTAKNLIQFHRVEFQAINSDIHCRSCGYNLRGLQSSGKCPECAVDIAVSLAPSRHFTQRRHGRLAGIGVWMIVLLTALEIPYMVAWILFALDVVPSQLRQAVELLFLADPFLGLLIFSAQSIALFCFTAAIRSQIRAVVFVCLVILVVMEIVICFGRLSPVNIIFFIATGFAVVFNALWLGHAAIIAKSAPHETVARGFLLLRWIFPVFLAIHFLCTIMPPNEMVNSLLAISDAMVILLSCWTIYLFLKLRKIIQRQSPRADEIAPVRVREALSPELLHSGQAWIKWVSAGLGMECIWIALGSASAFAAFFGSWLTSTATRYVFSSTAWSPSDPAASFAYVFFMWAPRVLFIWWMTVPLPEKMNPLKAEPDSINLRTWLRFFVVCAVVAALVPPIYRLHEIHPSESIQWIRIVLDSCLAFCFYMFIEKELASLLGSDDIRQLAKLLKWLVLGVGSIASEALYYAELYGGISRWDYNDLQGARRMVSLVVDILAMWLLYSCWRSFRRALGASTPPITADVI